MVFFGKVAIFGLTGVEEYDDGPVRTFDQMIRRRGKREAHLRGIVDRKLIMPPPDDLLGFMRWHEAKKQRESR